MGTSKRYSAEVRERAVRMVAERLHEYSSQWRVRLHARLSLPQLRASTADLRADRFLVYFVVQSRMGQA